MFFHKKKKSWADKLTKAVTIENGFAFLKAIDQAITLEIYTVEAGARLAVLRAYWAAFEVETKTMITLEKKLEQEGEL